MKKDLYSVSKSKLQAAFKRRRSSGTLTMMIIYIVIVLLSSTAIYVLKGVGNTFLLTGIIPGIVGFVRKHIFAVFSKKMYKRRKKLLPYVINIIYNVFISLWFTIAGIFIAIAGTVMYSTDNKFIIYAADLLTGVGFIIPEIVFMSLFGWLLIQFILYCANYKFDEVLEPDILTVKESVKKKGPKYSKEWNKKYIECLEEADVNKFQALISPHIERIYLAKEVKPNIFQRFIANFKKDEDDE